MLKLKLKNLNKIAAFFKNLPKFLAEKAFVVSLILILIALTLGGLLFYKYGFLAEKREPEVLERQVLLNEEAIQEILKIWQERQEKFEKAETKEYPNPFSVD